MQIIPYKKGFQNFQEHLNSNPEIRNFLELLFKSSDEE
jgi:hypothetical protein